MSATPASDGVLSPPMTGRESKAARNPASTRRLIRSAQRGSPDAIEELVRRYWSRARSVAFGVLLDAPTAEDVAQEAMLAAIRRLDRFEPRRRFEPWLFRIVTNKALDELRARGRRPVPTETMIERAAAPDATPLPGDLTAALSRLPETERSIVVLRHLADLNSREIGDALDLKPATVRSALARSLDQMRIYLDGIDPDREAIADE